MIAKLSLVSRHSIQHYTNQLAKDTSVYIKDLNALPPAPTQSEQRHQKMQRERLHDEYTTTLNVFQAAQRGAAHKEKEQINKAKAQAYGDPFLGTSNSKCLNKLCADWRDILQPPIGRISNLSNCRTVRYQGNSSSSSSCRSRKICKRCRNKNKELGSWK